MSLRQASDKQLKEYIILAGSNLEARTLFESPQYQESYEFPYNPDPLARGNNYNIYDEMCSDDQIKAVIAIKKNFVVNTGWKIVCEDNEKIVEEVTETLNRINENSTMESTFDDIILDILSAYEYGFSMTEPVFFLREDGLYAYKSLKVRPPHTFQFKIDKKGNVEKVIQCTAEGDLELKPDIFLHHVYQQRFGNPYGLSDLNSAHSAWKAKKFVERFLAIYLERFASPLTVGRYKRGMTTDEINEYLNMLKTIQNNTHVVIPEDAQLDIIQTSRDSSDSYIKSLDYYNMRIARAILVPDLLGLGSAQTGSHGGSLALGEKHFDVFIGTIKKDRESLEAKITKKLIQPLVRINYGEGIDCRFEFEPFTDDDIIEYAKVWLQAVNGKVFKANPEEVNHLRSITGFPQGDVADVPDPSLEDPNDPTSPFKPKALDPNRDPKGEDDPKKKKPPEGKDPKEPVAENIRLYRRKTRFEAKMDFGRIQQTLETGETSVRPELEKVGKKLIQDFGDQMNDKGIVRNFNPEKVNLLKPKFQRDLNTTWKGYFTDLFQSSVDEARREIFPNGEKKAFERNLLPEQFMELLIAESFKVTGDYTMQVTGRMKNVLVDGIKAGEGEGTIVKKAIEEARKISERWLNTVVRTKTTEIYNSARRSYWETDPLASQLVVAYQYSAIIDTRTTQICSDLDGEVFPINEVTGRVTPPLHFGCRSILVPVTKFEDFTVSEIPGLDSIREAGGGLKKF